MFMQAQLTIDTFVFHSDIFTPAGTVEAVVKFYDAKMRLYDRKVRIAQYQNMHGQLTIPPPISGGAPNDISDLEVLLRGITASSHAIIVRAAEEGWNGLEGRVDIFVKDNAWDNFRPYNRIYTGIVNGFNIFNDHTLQVSILPKFRAINRVNIRRWSDADHRQNYPDDNWFGQLAELERIGQEILF